MDFSFRYLACQYINTLILIFIPEARTSVWKRCLLRLKWDGLLSKANGNYCPPVVQKGGLYIVIHACICSTVNKVYVRLGWVFLIFILNLFQLN